MRVVSSNHVRFWGNSAQNAMGNSDLSPACRFLGTAFQFPQIIGCKERRFAYPIQQVRLLRFQRDQPSEDIKQIKKVRRVFGQPSLRLNFVQRRWRTSVADDGPRAVAAAIAEPMPEHLLA